MAYTLSGNVSFKSKFLQQSTLGTGNVYTGTPTLEYSHSYGTSDITKVYIGRSTVTTTPTVLDVLSLADPFGTALTFITIKHVIIINNSTTIDLVAGGGDDPIIPEIVLVGRTGGSALSLDTAITVGGSPGEQSTLLSLTAASGSISVDVMIVGS